MDQERYARVRALVVDVLAQPAAERQAWLDAACRSDPALRRSVDTLLDQAALLPPLLASDDDARLLEFVDGLETVPPPSLPDRIGHYRLHEVLGEGGMGIVVRATQDVPLRRDVALKLVRHGLSAARILARFDAERQALASLDHPCIARIFDAGSTDDGRPYFAMEYVEGMHLTAFADEAQLTVGERLDLFLAVCAGVEHAHQKGIIHRDLKPSNILVSGDARAFRPRIIDFGVSRAVAESQEDGLTLAGHLIGTPDFMSPEQAGVIDAGVDTRTDVYALGVILFELLCGGRPYRLTTATPLELQRVLGGPAPPRPSHAACADDGRVPADERAAHRRTTVERLSRQLRGDLDNIVLKALDREPARRYGSVQELAEDVRRHLSSQPVHARAATWQYRTAKFVHRHAWPVAAASAALLMLVTLSTATAIQSVRLSEERDRARREAATAEAVSGFMVDLFRVSDPSHARGNSVTAREILDRGADRIHDDLPDQPAVQARYATVLGKVYHALGLYEPAESSCSWPAPGTRRFRIPTGPVRPRRCRRWASSRTTCGIWSGTCG